MKRNYLLLQASKRLFTLQFYADLLKGNRDSIEDWFEQNDPVCYPAFITYLVSPVDLKCLIIYLQNKKALYEQE